MRIAGPTAPPDFLTKQIIDRPQAVADTVLDNDGFFPVIALRDFMERFQVPLTDDQSLPLRLQCLQEAMFSLNHALKEQACDWMRGGYTTLGQVPQGLQGDCPALLYHYRTALYSHTLVLLAERYRSTDTTHVGERQAVSLESNADHWYGTYLTHLNALRGQASWELEAVVI